MKLSNGFSALLFAAGLTLALGGYAQAGHGDSHRGKRDRACAEDRQKLCPDAKRGEAWQCLVENQAQLSEACSAKMSKHQERRAAFEQACGQDVAAFCSDVDSDVAKPGKRGIKRCLKTNRDKLSDTCQGLLAEKQERRQQRRAAFEEACGQDVAALCADRTEGKRGAMRCLFEKRDALSDVCVAKLDEIRSHHRK